jgi:hypothetical protein
LRVAPRDAAHAALLGPDWEDGLQFFAVQSGAAFALVLVPAGQGHEQPYAEVLKAVRTTLAPTE